MRTYYLKMLYPGATSRLHGYSFTVSADTFSIYEGSIVFSTNTGKKIAVYPVNYTIIKEIIENKSK